MEAYLDIETTGLSPRHHQITVIGIYVENSQGSRFTQLVGRDIHASSIREALAGAKTLFTYNGSRFDLPFIQIRHHIDLAREIAHCDLMHNCHMNSLYGGLKRVEQTLSIPRKLAGVDGLQAIRLWWRYVDSFDLDALNLLLEYNREDVLNLKLLKNRLLELSR